MSVTHSVYVIVYRFAHNEHVFLSVSLFPLRRVLLEVFWAQIFRLRLFLGCSIVAVLSFGWYCIGTLFSTSSFSLIDQPNQHNDVITSQKSHSSSNQYKHNTIENQRVAIRCKRQDKTRQDNKQQQQLQTLAILYVYKNTH